jgi:hypothetical protein
LGGQQVGEDEAVAFDDFAGRDAQRGGEHGAGEREGVKFTVFAAGVHAGGQFVEQTPILSGT